MKKNIYLALSISIAIINIAMAQKDNEKVKLCFVQNLSIKYLKLTGQTDISRSGTAIQNDRIFPNAPIYQIRDTNSLVMGFNLSFGLKIPFYKNDTWAIGSLLNIGGGYDFPIKAAEGLKGLTLDLPQYLYFRNYKHRFDYSILLGYKYTYSALPYSNILLAFDINIQEKETFRFYVTPLRYIYYTQFSDGRLEPAAKIGEFGISYVHFF
jgi:hypothetical protein